MSTSFSPPMLLWSHRNHIKDEMNCASPAQIAPPKKFLHPLQIVVKLAINAYHDPQNVFRMPSNTCKCLDNGNY